MSDTLEFLPFGPIPTNIITDNINGKLMYRVWTR
jgi:hypothetical protein